MTLEEVLAELRSKASPTTRATLLKHGAPESLLGVKVGDLKPIQKRLKCDHELALALYDSDIPDAMSLASYLLDDAKTTKAQLQRWADRASWYMLSEFAVAWAASASRFGWEMGLKWIASKKAHVASSGWATLASWVSLRPDAELDLAELERLLGVVESGLVKAPNRVRYTMNGFVISVGTYVAPLRKRALQVAKKIGKVEVEMGETSCQVPDAAAAIAKAVERTGGKKRKMARC